MFSTLDGQLAAGVEMDNLRHAVKRAAVLAQDVLVLLRPRQLHVHEALTAPADSERQKTGTENIHLVSFIKTTSKVYITYHIFRGDNFNFQC